MLAHLLSATAAAAPVGIQAFYVLFSEQVDSPNWPQKLCQNNGVGPQGGECVDARKYENGVFIASPQNMTKEHIAKIKSTVKREGLVWGENCALKPVAYGIKKICMTAVIPMNVSMDEIIDDILEDVFPVEIQSMEMTNMSLL